MIRTLEKATDDGDDKDRFVPCFQTKDLQFMELLKHYLEQNQIPHYVSGSDLMPLAGGIAFDDAILTLYTHPHNISLVEEFLKETNGENPLP
ncbi:MAG: hypothetical protein AAF518_10660 [Spirochaetota bacterium]